MKYSCDTDLGPVSVQVREAEGREAGRTKPLGVELPDSLAIGA